MGNTFTNVDGSPGLTLSPAPTNNSNDAGVDGTVNIVGQSAEVYFGNQTVTAGTTITVPLLVTAGNTPITITSSDDAFSYDPNKLTLTNVTNAGGLLSGFSLTSNPNTTAGTERATQSTSGNGASLAAGQTGTLLFLTFTVNGSATGTTVLNLEQNIPPTTTNLNGVPGITLSPAPNNNVGNGQSTGNPDPTDGLLTIIAAPTNQPPQDTVPSAQQTLSGNKLVFSTANGDPITVSDHALPTLYAISSATESGTTVTITTTSPTGFTVGQAITVQGVTTTGYNGTWTVASVSGNSFTYTAATGLTTPATLNNAMTYSVVGPVETGNEQTTVSVAHGTLTPGSNVPSDVSVSGSGTGVLVLTGPVTDITTALNGLTYVSPSIYAGGDNLTVSTNDEGYSGAGGPQLDSRSVAITDVRLYINEVFATPPTTGIAAGNQNKSAYIEIRSSVPNFILPAGTYFVEVNGRATRDDKQCGVGRRSVRPFQQRDRLERCLGHRGKGQPVCYCRRHRPGGNAAHQHRQWCRVRKRQHQFGRAHRAGRFHQHAARLGHLLPHPGGHGADGRDD